VRIKKIDNSVINLLYSMFNKLLFKGKLPKVLVKMANLDGMGPGGCDLEGVYLVYKDSRLNGTIFVDISAKDPVRTLLHEMVHVWVFKVRKIDDSGHPPVFVRKLSQVYKKTGLGPPTYVERD
jgi:SprT-like family